MERYDNSRDLFSNRNKSTINQGFIPDYQISRGYPENSKSIHVNREVVSEFKPHLNLTKSSFQPSTSCQFSPQNLDNFAKNCNYDIPAVRVESGVKSYGETKVLQNINMTVQRGSIYGLLGSSGCGKTTILSCLVGLKKLDSGTISIFGKGPGSKSSGIPGKLIGYMPQQVALNEEFTIKEVCHYFGRLYGMGRSEVSERVKYLVKILDLDSCKGHIKNFRFINGLTSFAQTLKFFYSGGQKRRASFVVSLLHKAQILILDEPTVGVDPILRSSIWSHLREIVKSQNITVIITTHYIEEMRRADCVGIMRDGVLMAEDSPQNLLDSHNANMLEEVVLNYCLKNIKIAQLDQKENLNVKLKQNKRDSLTGEQNNFHNLVNPNYIQKSTQEHGHREEIDKNEMIFEKTRFYNRILAMIYKNILIMSRNIGFLLFIFAMPALIMSSYCLTLGSYPTNISLGIINQDNLNCSKETLLKCSADELSCSFLDLLNTGNIINSKYYDNISAATNDVNRLKIWGYIHIGQNFSQYIFNNVVENIVNNETYSGSKINVKLDFTSPIVGQLIKKEIYEAYIFFSLLLRSACNINTENNNIPVNFESPFYGDDTGEMRDFSAGPLGMGFLSFLSSLTCGLGYIIEKKDGMLGRGLVAGLESWEIMFSHFLPQLGVAAIQTGFMYFIQILVFEIKMVGSLLTAYSLTLLNSVAGMCLGFFASSIFDEEKNAMMLAISAILPSLLFSGLLWPIEGISRYVKYVSYILPWTYPAESLRSISFRGWDLTYETVWIGFISTIAWTGIYILLTYIVLKFRKN